MGRETVGRLPSAMWGRAAGGAVGAANGRCFFFPSGVSIPLNTLEEGRRTLFRPCSLHKRGAARGASR